jgi:hypothetical protein
LALLCHTPDRTGLQRLYGLRQGVPHASSYLTPSTSPVAFQRVGNPACMMPSPRIFGVFMVPHLQHADPPDLVRGRGESHARYDLQRIHTRLPERTAEHWDRYIRGLTNLCGPLAVAAAPMIDHSNQHVGNR